MPCSMYAMLQLSCILCEVLGCLVAQLLFIIHAAPAAFAPLPCVHYLAAPVPVAS